MSKSSSADHGRLTLAGAMRVGRFLPQAKFYPSSYATRHTFAEVGGRAPARNETEGRPCRCARAHARRGAIYYLDDGVSSLVKNSQSAGLSTVLLDHVRASEEISREGARLLPGFVGPARTAPFKHLRIDPGSLASPSGSTGAVVDAAHGTQASSSDAQRACITLEGGG